LLSLRITLLAKEDLKNIGRYSLKQWGLQQRNSYLSNLNDSFKTLLAMPKIGAPCDHIRQGYRKFREAEHVIFYRVNNGTLDVIRILHKSMDFEYQNFL
jgi:toxin ParE1/3/4